MTGDRLRILMVSNRLPPQVVGGAELVAAQQMRALQARGHVVVGFALDWLDQGAHAGGDEDLDVRRAAADEAPRLRAGLETRRAPRTERAFEGVLTAVAPHVVHFHNQAGLTLRLPRIAARRRVPVVATFHDAFGVCPNHILFTPDGAGCAGFRSVACVPCLERARGRRLSVRRRLLMPFRNLRVRRALAGLDRFVFPSGYHRDLYTRAGYPASRCRVLANPIDLAPYGEARPPQPDASSPLRVLFLGSSGPHKGLHVLLDAFAALPPGAALLRIHGRDAPDGRRALQRRLGDLGIQDRVVHGGPLRPDAVPRAMAGADVVVVPSVCAENAPLTIVEAMAARRPVVASHVGGIPELVRPGVTGLLVPPGHAPALTAALQWLAGDRGLVRHMGEEAGRHIADHDLTAHVDELVGVYRELRAARRAGQDAE